MSSKDSFDLIVVGSGPAGLMTALRAAYKGLSVALVETEEQIGGTGRGSAYGIWIPQNRLLRERGIEEDKTTCLRWMCKHAYPNVYNSNAEFYGIPEVDYLQFSQYFDSAAPMLDFLEQESGIELVFMRNHGDDHDTYKANQALLAKKGLPEDNELTRALPDYHPEDEDNQVPLGRYVNFKSNLLAMMAYFIAMFRQMEAKLLISACVEFMRPSVLVQLLRGFFAKHDEGAFYYCGAGIRMTSAFKRLMQKYQVNVLTHTKVIELLFNEADEIRGALVEQQGRQKQLLANNVVMTVGGFAHNPSMMKKYASEFPVQRSASRPTCDGKLLESLKNKAQLGHMSDIWQTESLLALTQGPVETSDFIGSTNVWHLNGDSAIVVDIAGNRCYNEADQYSMRSKWYRAGDKEVAIYVFDQRTISNFGGLLGTWSAHLPELSHINRLRPDYIVAGDTIDSLTDKLRDHLKNFETAVNCTLDQNFNNNLTTSIQRFNDFAKSGIDKDFNRGGSVANLGWRAKRAKDNHYPNKTMHPISDSGPYYAMALCLSCFNTKGGLQTNEHAQVLDNNNTPIKGLYAAGNCAASPSNTGYVLSTIGPALTFGFVAAEHIAERAISKRPAA